MSSNKLIYDCDHTVLKNLENKNQMQYSLSPDKFYNVNQVRINRGIISGNDVSINKGNLVDLESELKGVNKIASKAPNNKYPHNTMQLNKYYIRHNDFDVDVINIAKKDLQTVDMFDYSNLLLQENKFSYKYNDSIENKSNKISENYCTK